MHPQQPLYALLALALALPAFAAGNPQENEPLDQALGWTQWRGPTRDGRVAGPEWPADLSAEHLSETWRCEGLGPSYSGPVVDATRVYTTETMDEEFELVRAFSRSTGEELWQTRWSGAMEVPFFASRNGSWIRSTPAVDGDSLYVAGMREVLKCIDVESGEIRWSADFPERFGTPLPPFGCASSPLLTDSHVYIQAGAAVLKLDKASGKTIWRSMVEEGDVMSGGAFSSPVIASLRGRRQLVVQSRTHLAGIALDDGRILWSTPVKAFRGMNILTPTVVDDAVFTSSYGARSVRFAVEGDEAGLAVRQEWDAPTQGYMTTPVVSGGHAYLFSRSNRFGCIDLESGEEVWTSPPTGDEYWSLALQGNRILALSNTGLLRLVRADPSGYEVLSERQVSDGQTWAHVAPTGSQVFVRAQDSLLALEWR